MVVGLGHDCGSGTRRMGDEPSGCVGRRPPAGIAHESVRLTDPMGWAGGDGASSIRLPGGRIAWLFADTVTSWSWMGGMRWAHNSIVITGRGRPRIIRSPIPMFADGSFLWPGASRVRAGELWVLAEHVGHYGPGLFDFGSMGTWLVRLNLRTWSAINARPVADMSHHTDWSNGLFDYGAYTYIYGVETEGLQTWLHVARVPRGRLDLSWEFSTGRGWTTDPARSARLLSRISRISVLDLGRRGMRLISQQPVLSQRVFCWRATSPAGPFTQPRLIYDTGSMGPGTYTYGTVADPAYATRTTMLFSFDGNSYVLVDPRTLAIYRPHFFQLRLAGM
jgi:hypothetical protein